MAKNMACMHGIGDMGRGRKKAVVHPGQPCGPCHLCQQSSSRYCHIATWDEDLKCKMKDLTAIGEDKCICRACETDFKTNIGKNNYTYRWMRALGKKPGLSRCIVMSCTERDRIIHTGIATKEKIEDLLHEKVCSEPKHLQTSLCVNHYKQILYCNEAMYTDKRCCTCHTLIRYCGTARHCPNPAAVNMYFSMNGDTDINITEKDYVCSSLGDREYRFYAPGANSEEHHMQWYNGIRSCIWERITFEEHLPPSFEALNLH